MNTDRRNAEDWWDALFATLDRQIQERFGQEVPTRRPASRVAAEV